MSLTFETELLIYWLGQAVLIYTGSCASALQFRRCADGRQLQLNYAVLQLRSDADLWTGLCFPWDSSRRTWETISAFHLYEPISSPFHKLPKETETHVPLLSRTHA